MGILRALYLKQNIGGNVDILLQNKGTVTSIVVVCRPCSRKWRILVNIGDFEGLAFSVYLSVIRERQGRRSSQNCSSAKPKFTPKFASPRSRRDRLRSAHENLLRII